MPHRPLTNFEIQKYHQIKAKFNSVYLINNLSKMKDGAYIIDLDEYESTGSLWITFYVNFKNVTYFGSFGVEHIPKETKKNSMEIIKIKQIFIECKHTTQ